MIDRFSNHRPAFSPEDDGIDGVDGPLGVGCDAPTMAGPDEPVSEYLRTGTCYACNDTVILPPRMVRGVRSCECGRYRLTATCLSGMMSDRRGLAKLIPVTIDHPTHH